MNKGLLSVRNRRKFQINEIDKLEFDGGNYVKRL